MMKWSQPNAEVFVPDGAECGVALKRTRTMIVAAHQDDAEFMGFPLIRDAYAQGGSALGVVIVTNGAGSPRAGVYEKFTDEQMQAVRREEQRTAARLGKYSFLAQLQFPSSVTRTMTNSLVTDEIAWVLEQVQPEVVMTHNVVDRHATHIATALRTIAAIRKLPKEKRPKQFLGAEIWRGLDWLPDSLKVRLDAGGHDSLAAALMGCFDSQIVGGKRYDTATFGRRHANATYDQSHAVDTMEQVVFAMDMTELVQNDALSVDDFVERVLVEFGGELRGALKRIRN